MGAPAVLRGQTTSEKGPIMTSLLLAYRAKQKALPGLNEIRPALRRGPQVNTAFSAPSPARKTQIYTMIHAPWVKAFYNLLLQMIPNCKVGSGLELG